MNIALIAHDNKKELMVQFCTAYCGILAQHTLCATATTGLQISEATGLRIHRFLSFDHGGGQQIAARIAYNEIDMVLCFGDPNQKTPNEDVANIFRLCDQNNIPYASNLASAQYCQSQNQALYRLTSGPGCHKIGKATAIKETGVPSSPPAPERRVTGCKRAPAGEAKTVPQRGWKRPRPAPRNRSREGPLGLNLGGTTKRIHALSSQTGDGSAFFHFQTQLQPSYDASTESPIKTQKQNRKEIDHHGNCDPPDPIRLHGAAACAAAAAGADDGHSAHHL